MKRPEALDTLRELDKQAPHPTYVTAFRPEADPNEEVWTLSKNPDDEGWSTDGGYSGYGMTKARATVYAEARNALPDILAYVTHLERENGDYRQVALIVREVLGEVAPTVRVVKVRQMIETVLYVDKGE